ncbi:TetR/AcrR family transcriptional regulator [Paenibacillus beijingensis]|uniref:Transcriptional regulator n=1 Tax=Paenibacillus beijingensis TaxID=1126833 RepID=A0A0D5NJH7_9BACL|nr:TetR/AcrR family transcriptional regulator [Paenibacillus beijingensis]AJY75529.1 transcriptional regulator [Paenibacillus beijingensis]
MGRVATQRRNQILRATLQAISDKGFDAVTLQDIADYAEVSKGVPNYYFENKDDVFYHLFEWLTEKIYKNESEAIAKETSAVDKLRAYVNSAFVSPNDNKRFFKVYLDFLSKASRNARLREINQKFYENCWTIGKEIVLLGQQEGAFSSVNADHASVTIRALIDGSLIQWLMRDDESIELHQFYRETCYQTLLSYLTNKTGS